MSKLTFYEQTGIVIPGSVFLFGLMFLLPDLRDTFIKDNISVGGLGLFVLVAYAAGHLIAAVGNLVEKALWGVRGGMPSDWITHANPRILNAQQVSLVAERVRQRFGLKIGEISGMPRREWASFFGQIYRDVLAHNPGRLETFNGNYGLNRGLAAALICLAAATVIVDPTRWRVAAALLAIGGVYLYRMHRFGANFARELYYSFLNLRPGEPGEKAVGD